MNKKLFRNKYRTQTTRLKGWDYSSSGWYFITVCTKKKEHYFDEIIDAEMHQQNDMIEHHTNKFQKMIKNLVSSIINHFKGRVTKYTIKENIEFEWQSKFYDHIVRDNDEFLRIQKYIIENPLNWKDDKFYTE